MICWQSPGSGRNGRAVEETRDPERRIATAGPRPANWRAVVVPFLAGLAGLATAGLGACDHSPTDPGFHIAAAGFVERSATITLTLVHNGAPVPSSSVTWQGAPAAAIAIAPTGIARLVDTGTVTVTAVHGGVTATLVLHVAAPPTILFDMQDSDGTGDRNVYRAALNGGDLLQLTSSSSDNEQPAVAGGTVVFTSYRTGTPALYQIAVTGGTDAALADAPANASQPALSADGTRLAFIAPLNGADHLWTANGDGSNAAPVNAGPDFASAIQASPSWAPQGDTLVVTTTQYGDAALARLAVATGAETPLTNGSTTDIDAAWSPDGKQIVFASTRDGDLGLFTMILSTGAVKRLTPQPATDAEPAWLADGRIVFTAVSGSTTQLRWLDPASPDSGQVIPTPANGGPRHATAAN